MELRRMERRDQRLSSMSSTEIAEGSSPAAIASSKSSSILIGQLSSEASSGSSSSAKPPPHLPSSGPAMEIAALFFLAAYCAVLQKRAMAVQA